MIHTQLTLFIHTLKTHNNYEQNNENGASGTRLHHQSHPRRSRWCHIDVKVIKRQQEQQGQLFLNVV